jgi:hypothetical protein
MPVELFVVPEAENDVFEAYRWYEEHRTDLGEEFLSCVDACLQRIRRSPEGPSSIHEE